VESIQLNKSSWLFGLLFLTDCFHWEKIFSVGFKNEEYDWRSLIKWPLPTILSRISAQLRNATLSMTKILFLNYNSANLSRKEPINCSKLSLSNRHVCLTLCRIFFFSFCKLNAKLCNWSDKTIYMKVTFMRKNYIFIQHFSKSDIEIFSIRKFLNYLRIYMKF